MARVKAGWLMSDDGEWLGNFERAAEVDDIVRAWSSLHRQGMFRTEAIERCLKHLVEDRARLMAELREAKR